MTAYLLVKEEEVSDFTGVRSGNGSTFSDKVVFSLFQETYPQLSIQIKAIKIAEL